MSPNCFVEPATVPITLSNGHTVEFKKKLTYAEQRRLSGGVLRTLPGDGPVDERTYVDMEHGSIERLYTWIARWDLEDKNGNEVAVSRAAITNLEPEIGAEIDLHLSAHIQAVNALSQPESAELAIAEHRQAIELHERAIAEIEKAKNVRKPG